VVQVSAGGRHGVLLLDTGDVLTYGENGHGQLGNGDRLPIASPRAVNALRAERVRCVAVAAGRMHTLAVDESGALLAWGFGKNGATGQRSLEDALTPVKIELRGSTAGSANPGRVQTVACSDHCLAVTADGAVYAWGLGASGQLGFGDLLSHSKPRRVEALREVRAVGVSTGHSHSLVLSEAGAVFAFGRGTSGQLGRKVHCPPPFFSFFLQVAAGGDHSLLLGVNGVVFTFGSGDFGVLGQGGTLPSPTPKKISAGLGIERVTAISAGFLHSIVVTVVRQTFTFGSNSSLQLG
ncbi:regulator of chromosome condensation 1/beta-lactamase-inhibitor protein II, partial [Pavlovales sp. CCMP2436]